MNPREFYHTELSTIPMRNLIKYLTSHAWTQIDLPKFTDICILRKKFGEREEEITLPRDQSFIDYYDRLFDAIASLSKLENLPLTNVIEDLLTLEADVLRIRFTGESIGSGKIPFLDEIIAKDGLKKVLASAACHVLDPKPYYKKLYRAEAEQLLRNCQLGRPEQGSYIIKLYIPLVYTNEPTEKKEPFSRLVTKHLMTSLKRLIDSVNQDTPNSKQSNLLNSNLCFGLVEMIGDSNVNLDFRITWSEAVSIDSETPKEVKILNTYMPEISKIGEFLKPQHESTQSDFIGKISALDGAENEEGLIEGEATIILFVDEGTKKAKVPLPPKFYREACNAHVNGNYVKITGLLKEKPRVNSLENIVHFEVIPK